MTVARESVYAALFALVSGLTDSSGDAFFNTALRRMPTWTATPGPAQTPALYQVEGKEKSVVKGLGMPAKWELYPHLVIFTSVGQDQKAIPSQILNPILDALETVMPPGNGQAGAIRRQSLGGLVYDCRIEGEVWINEASLGGTAVALVPIRIVAL